MKNAYISLADFKYSMVTRGQAANILTDTTDDSLIETMIQNVSRYIDSKCVRKFYPHYETKYISVPEDYTDLSILYFGDDLLEVTSITNGDTVVVTSTQYNLLPKNYYPKYAAKLLTSASITWNATGAGDNDFSISVDGLWGFHNDYTRAWSSVGTLGAAISNTTATTFTMTAGHAVTKDSIVKIDTEIFNVSNVSTNTITVSRGDNGSTAAAHLNGATVYVWNTQDEIKQACLDVCMNMYMSRNGQQSAGRISFTQSGIVIRPEDVSPLDLTILETFKRKVL